jgi:hypothetical protein
MARRGRVTAELLRADIRRHRQLLKQQSEQREERNPAAVMVVVAKRHRLLGSNHSVETVYATLTYASPESDASNAVRDEHMLTGESLLDVRPVREPNSTWIRRVPKPGGQAKVTRMGENPHVPCKDLR